jgi:uncharacterized protein (TIGR03437 family)
MLNRLSRTFLIMAAVTGITASAQTTANWDNSGNGMLNGTYYFRHVLWIISDSGDLSDAYALYGNISFDGDGNYTINGLLLEAQACEAEGDCPTEQETITGTYQISASGFGFMDNPLDSDDEIYGLVTNKLSPGQPGIFMGSSTETQDGYNDMFIAAPLASPAPTAASLSGSYAIAGIDYPVVDQEEGAAYSLDYVLSFSANGAGKISSNGTATGFITANGGSPTNQSIGSVNYTASSGAFNVNFGGSLTGTNLLAGTHYLYSSPDGNFVFGGSPQGWDMIVGTRNPVTSAPTFSGLYYAAGMDVNVFGILEGEDSSTPDSYYGSLVPLSGSYLLHQRVNNQFNNNSEYTSAYDYTANDPLTFNSNGTEDDPYSSQHYVFGAGGAIRIGIGNLQTGVQIGLQLAIQAPTFSGSGVYLNPTGVQNAANSALFTAGIAPGELITLAGSGFSTGSFANPGLSLATNLGGTQVLVTYETSSGATTTAAPLVYVTPGLIAAQLPFEIDGATTPILAFQVVAKSGSSNVVTLFQGPTQPGFYTIPSGGNGTVAAVSVSTNQLITAGNPATPNESLYAYVNGLGAVSPTIADGAPATGALSYANNTINFDFLDPNTFDSFPASSAGVPSFAGLAPPYAGLYQINFAVPATDSSGNGITSGNLYLELYGFDSTVSSEPVLEAFNSQSLIPVAGGVTTSEQPDSRGPLAHGRRGPNLGPGTRKIIHSHRRSPRAVPRTTVSGFKTPLPKS